MSLDSSPLGPLSVIEHMWEREASREDAVREFKTFAVNCMHKLLAYFETYSSIDLTVLERTVHVWRESIGVGSY